MSNANNYQFSPYLEKFRTGILEAQVKKVQDAKKIMDDPNYAWKDEEARKSAQARYDSIKAWLAYYEDFYKEAKRLEQQHETLVNNLAKWYNTWREDVSNEGRQETEIMSMQADILNSIFSEIYKELQPLNLDIKTPKGLNL